MASTGNRYKKMVYDYDLISGKVNKVAYQPGFTDEFYHKYTYDAENRITDVETSHDGWLWEKDARYSYYKHGPLARTILGQQQVQGLDYAYTLQGWLKGVNSTTVNDGTYDMGGDGKTGAGLNPVARDVFGFSLNYFGGDYKPIGGTSAFAAITAPTPITVSGQELFNGNIGAMAVNIPKLGDAHLYRYRYDQLNRIVAMDAFTGLNSSTNAWTPSATDNYKERVSYDPNGNILTYLRNGTTAGGNPQTMDNFTYGYNLSSGKLVNNRLRHVKDAVSSGNYAADIDNQSDDNYTYDAIGNLTADAAEGISSISWNTYGKIASITKSGSTINYSYDVAGNRITKEVATGGITKTTVYVRDASGNVMSLYEQGTSSAHLMQEEAHLYGSSRLGIFNVKRDVNSIAQIDHLDNIATFIRGNKFFELGNHLGNVLVTVADTKTETDGNTDGLVDYYTANVISANDYYPFGMTMPGRKYEQTPGKSYRYGFNGKELDNSTGEGNLDFGARIYDNRLGRWLGVDKYADKYPNVSPYAFCVNSPLQFKDANGNWLVDKNGNIIYTMGVASYEQRGNEVYQAATYYFYTNDGQAVEVGRYMLKSTVDNVEWADEGKTKFLDFKDRDKVYVFPDMGNPESSSCHGNTLNLRPGIDLYIAGLDGQGCDNVSKIFKNKAEFTPVKAEDVKPGDVAIFEDDKGNIQHSATVTKVGKNGKVKLTSKDDRNPVKKNQTIDDVKKTNPAYKNFAGYYRKNANKKVDVEVSTEGFKGNAGNDDGEEIKKILEEAKKKE